MMLIKKKEKQTNKNKQTAHLSTIHLWYHGSFLAIGYHTFLLTEPPYSRLFFSLYVPLYSILVIQYVAQN